MKRCKIGFVFLFIGSAFAGPLSLYEMIKPGGLVDNLKQVGATAQSTFISRNPRESLSYAPVPKQCIHTSTNSGFFVRVFSSCGTDCCNSSIKKRCTGVVVKEDTVLVAASCVIGYNCFKICYGSDLCGEREPCVNSKEAYVHPNYLDNVHLRLKFEDNLAIIKIPLLKKISSIEIARFKEPDCHRFVGTKNAFKFIGCGDGSGDFPKIQRSIDQKPVGATELNLVYGIGKNSSEPQPCCGDEGGPLVIYGEDLLTSFGKELDPLFRKAVNKKHLYLLAVLSYFEKPCDTKSKAVYTCLNPYQPLFDGYSCESWTHLSVAHDLLLSIDNDGLNAIDNIYSSKNLKVKINGKSSGIRDLVSCIVDQRSEALKETKYRLKNPLYKPKGDNYQCGLKSESKKQDTEESHEDPQSHEEKFSSFLPKSSSMEGSDNENIDDISHNDSKSENDEYIPDEPKYSINEKTKKSKAKLTKDSQKESPKDKSLDKETFSGDEEGQAIKSKGKKIKPFDTSKVKDKKLLNDFEEDSNNAEEEDVGYDLDSQSHNKDKSQWPFDLSAKAEDIISQRDGTLKEDVRLKSKTEETANDTTENNTFRTTTDNVSTETINKSNIKTTEETETSSIATTTGSASNDPSSGGNDEPQRNKSIKEPIVKVGLGASQNDDDESNENVSAENISDDSWVGDDVPGMETSRKKLGDSHVTSTAFPDKTKNKSQKDQVGEALADDSEEVDDSMIEIDNSEDDVIKGEDESNKHPVGSASPLLSDEDDKLTTALEKSALGVVKLQLGDTQENDLNQFEYSNEGTTITVLAKEDTATTEKVTVLPTNDPVAQEVLNEVSKTSKQALGASQGSTPIDPDNADGLPLPLEQDEGELLSVGDVIEQAPEFNSEKYALGAPKNDIENPIHNSQNEEPTTVSDREGQNKIPLGAVADEATSTFEENVNPTVTEILQANESSKAALGSVHDERNQVGNEAGSPSNDVGETGQKVCSVTAD